MRLSVFAILAIGLAGCATSSIEPVALTAADRAAVNAAGQITVSMHETPGFLFNTPGGALVNAGMAAWKDPATAPSWGGIRTQHGINDLTETVRDKFVAEVERRSPAVNIAPAEQREPYKTNDDTAYVRQLTGDYVLEIRSQYGSFHYGTLSWKTYMLNYYGRARLIRTADEAIVWKQICQVKAGDNDILKVPVDDFLGETATGEQLRAAVDFATDSCVSQFVDSYTQ